MQPRAPAVPPAAAASPPVQPPAAAAAAAEEEHPFGKPPTDLAPWQPGPPTRVTTRGDVRLEVIDLRKPRDRGRFVDLTRDLHRADPNWIQPLRMQQMRFLDLRKNTALAQLEVHAVLAYRGSRCVGRITGHIDRAYDAYHGVRAGWFGFFESIDDRRVAHALLDEATRFVRDRGATEIIGPMNFTTNHQCGILVENFASPPFIEMTYNPPYYAGLVESYGFSKAKDLLVSWIDVSRGLEDPHIRRFHEVGEKVKKRYGLRIRGADMRRFEEEVATLFTLYNQAWQRNWGFVPVSEGEFKTIARDLKHIVIDSLVLIVEDKAGTPVGFSVTLPNINEIMPRDGRLLPLGWWKLLTGRKSIQTGRLFTLGVVPGYRKRGVESLLCLETALRAKELGMCAGEIGWTLEDNDLVNRAIEAMGGKVHRRYRLFGAKI
jgi:GNAT superfamily N-acetyltransferase